MKQLLPEIGLVFKTTHFGTGWYWRLDDCGWAGPHDTSHDALDAAVEEATYQQVEYDEIEQRNTFRCWR